MDRVLHVLRHATPETYAADFRDHSRALTEAGKEQVRRVAETLAGMSPRVQHVLVSTAMRTRQTAEGLRLGVDLTYSDTLYSGGLLGVCEEIMCVPDDVSSLLLVGHAPTVPTLVQSLSDPALSDVHALERLRAGYPTATLSRIELAGSWTDVQSARGRLTDVVWH